MNDIEEAHLKKTLEHLLTGMTELQKGQLLMTNAIIQCGQRLTTLEKANQARKFKPKIIGLNGKEIAAQ